VAIAAKPIITLQEPKGNNFFSKIYLLMRCKSYLTFISFRSFIRCISYIYYFIFYVFIQWLSFSCPCDFEIQMYMSCLLIRQGYPKDLRIGVFMQGFNFWPWLKRLSVFNSRGNFLTKPQNGGVKLYLAMRKREWVSFLLIEKKLTICKY
jgi:hypothetical protein